MIDGEAVFWTYDMVQERLVETVRCWWRMPGGGHWPFASDGPWHLVKSELYGPDVDKDAPVRKLPLRRREVDLMNEATEWITFVPDEDRRRVLVMGLGYLAKGEASIPWSRMLRRLGLSIGAGGLEWRYSRSIELIANVLNAMAGVKYATRKGALARYPREVMVIVDRLKAAENRAGNVSTPGI